MGVLLGEYLVGNALVTPEASRVLALASAAEEGRGAGEPRAPRRRTSSTKTSTRSTRGAGGPRRRVSSARRDPRLCARVARSRRARGTRRSDASDGSSSRCNADVDLSVLSLTNEEESALAVLRVEAPTLQVLFKSQVGDEEAIGSLVYTLAVTRQFAFREGSTDGARGTPRSRSGTRPWADRVSALPMGAVVEPSSSRERVRAKRRRGGPSASSRNHASTWRPPEADAERRARWRTRRSTSRSSSTDAPPSSGPESGALDGQAAAAIVDDPRGGRSRRAAVVAASDRCSAATVSAARIVAAVFRKRESVAAAACFPRCRRSPIAFSAPARAPNDVDPPRSRR